VAPGTLSRGLDTKWSENKKQRGGTVAGDKKDSDGERLKNGLYPSCGKSYLRGGKGMYTDIATSLKRKPRNEISKKDGRGFER